jgi:hypothetical protein
VAIREEPSVDAMGSPSKMPIWVEPYYGFRTQCDKRCGWLGITSSNGRRHSRSRSPPIVINVTDGMVTDSPYQGAGLTESAKWLTTIQTADGPALVLNAFLSPSQASVVSFPSRGDTLPQPGHSSSQSAVQCLKQ